MKHFYDFRSDWVATAYPDDDVSLPESVLKALYPEVAKLGPRCHDIQKLGDFFEANGMGHEVTNERLCGLLYILVGNLNEDLNGNILGINSDMPWNQHCFGDKYDYPLTFIMTALTVAQLPEKDDHFLLAKDAIEQWNSLMLSEGFEDMVFPITIPDSHPTASEDSEANV